VKISLYRGNFEPGRQHGLCREQCFRYRVGDPSGISL